MYEFDVHQIMKLECFTVSISIIFRIYIFGYVRVKFENMSFTFVGFISFACVSFVYLKCSRTIVACHVKIDKVLESCIKQVYSKRMLLFMKSDNIIFRRY